MASTGLSAPDSEDSGGIKKKLVSCACCAHLLNVAVTMPMLVPAQMQSAPPKSRKTMLPWNGTSNASLRTAMATSIIMHRRINNGVILAMMISEVDAGDISNCSIVPASLSRTMAADETSELFSKSAQPNTPVTINHESTSPGL